MTEVLNQGQVEHDEHDAASPQGQWQSSRGTISHTSPCGRRRQKAADVRQLTNFVPSVVSESGNPNAVVVCFPNEALAATLVTELSAVADEVLTLSGGGAPPPVAEPPSTDASNGDSDALGHDALDDLAQSAANRLDQHLTAPPPTTNKLSGSLRRLKVIVRDVRDGVGRVRAVRGAEAEAAAAASLASRSSSAEVTRQIQS